MISKYVTQVIKEMMDNINLKLEEGLSLHKYKRKLTAKMTGVSESELLMQESHTTLLSSLFVIKKESGLLIAQSQLGEKEIDDPHMVASMASAIKDFINDWVHNNASQSEVQLVSYGDATLYIESAGSVYVIAFLDGEPSHTLRLEINKFFASLLNDYTPFFQGFDGDDSASEIVKISKKMLVFLEKEKKKVVLIQAKYRMNISRNLFYLVGFIGVGIFSYHLFLAYLEYDLRRLVESKTGEKITIRASYDEVKLEGFVGNFESLLSIENTLKEETTREIRNNLLVSSKHLFGELYFEAEERAVADNYHNREKDRIVIELKELNRSVSFLENKLFLTQRQMVKIRYKTELEIKRLNQERETLIRQIEKELEEAFEGNPFYEKKNRTLNFGTLSLFLAGSSQYQIKNMKIVEINMLKYMEVLSHHREMIASVTIEGHSDSQGDERLNRELSKQRALNVRDYLWQLPARQIFYMQSLFEIDFFGSEQRVIEEGTENKVASRRIRIKFRLKENKIVKTIKKIMND